MQMFYKIVLISCSFHDISSVGLHELFLFWFLDWMQFLEQTRESHEMPHSDQTEYKPGHEAGHVTRGPACQHVLGVHV